jgi:hypothetical protein
MVDVNRNETDGAQIESVRLRALMRYWNEKRGNRPMPLRLQIDPIEIPNALPIVLLAEVTPAGPRMRLLGTEATNAYGRETHGHLVHEIQFGEFDITWQDAFDRVTQSAAPVVATGTYSRVTEICRVETLLLPLTVDGSSVNQIFGGLVIRPLAHDATIERKRRLLFTLPGAGAIEVQRAEPHRI